MRTLHAAYGLFRRQRAILGQQVSERDRGVQIDHGSLRSCCNSFMSAGKGHDGLARRRSAGQHRGPSHPWRTASASIASAITSRRPARGGVRSASTRSRQEPVQPGTRVGLPIKAVRKEGHRAGIALLTAMAQKRTLMIATVKVCPMPTILERASGAELDCCERRFSRSGGMEDDNH
jgi:hypothetical protein